jgi:hypothetical protein
VRPYHLKVLHDLKENGTTFSHLLYEQLRQTNLFTAFSWLSINSRLKSSLQFNYYYGCKFMADKFSKTESLSCSPPILVKLHFNHYNGLEYWSPNNISDWWTYVLFTVNQNSQRVWLLVSLMVSFTCSPTEDWSCFFPYVLRSKSSSFGRNI